MKNVAYEKFFSAVSNPSRLAIIQLLRKKEHSVLDIAARLGFEQSRVSHNLQCLVDCGFVVARQNGKQRLYAVEPRVVAPLLDLIDAHIATYERHLKTCGVLP